MAGKKGRKTEKTSIYQNLFEKNPRKAANRKILVYPLVINLGEVNSCLFVLGLTSNVFRRSYIKM